jgi:hypothetical protein
MNNLTLNDKPAVKIFAKQLVDGHKAILFDCEGDKIWLPKSCIKKLGNDTILIEEWFYKQKFPTR